MFTFEAQKVFPREPQIYVLTIFSRSNLIFEFMERRSFIKNGLVMAVGMQVPAGALLHFTPTVVSKVLPTTQQFSQFSQFCKARKKMLWFMPQPLQHCIAAYNQSVSALGYASSGASIYVAGNGQFCFYPMWQSQGNTGEKALILPIFCKDEKGSWYKSAVLNQYEIASLTEMANEKAADFTPHYTNLLPVGISISQQGDVLYKTADGTNWKVKTECKKDEISCTVSLVKPNGAVLSHKVNSQRFLI